MPLKNNYDGVFDTCFAYHGIPFLANEIKRHIQGPSGLLHSFGSGIEIVQPKPIQVLSYDCPILIGGVKNNDGLTLLNRALEETCSYYYTGDQKLQSGRIVVDENGANVQIEFTEPVGTPLEIVKPTDALTQAPTRCAKFYDFRTQMFGIYMFVTRVELVFSIQDGWLHGKAIVNNVINLEDTETIPDISKTNHKVLLEVYDANNNGWKSAIRTSHFPNGFEPSTVYLTINENYTVNMQTAQTEGTFSIQLPRP